MSLVMFEDDVGTDTAFDRCKWSKVSGWLCVQFPMEACYYFSFYFLPLPSCEV